jgi:hypothetical protein
LILIENSGRLSKIVKIKEKGINMFVDVFLEISIILFFAALILATFPSIAFSAHQGPPKAPWESIASDRERIYEVVVTSNSYEYQVVMGGSVDGVMTRMPISYSAYYQGWQPNRFLRLENIGTTDIVNPWVTVNNKRHWRTLKEIADEATVGCITKREKARAIWEFQRNHRFHACTWDSECNDAVKVYNIYGYTLCGNDAQVISDLWKAAGLKTRRGYPVGHCVAEAFYDGEYHLLDGDEHVICLRRDNETIASEAEVVRDHDLMKRTHSYSIGRADSRETDESSASLYGYEGERKGEHGGHSKHTMAYTLRPGESIEWRWDHIGKQYTAGTEIPAGRRCKDGEGELLAHWGKQAYDNMRNGKMRYAPDLSNPIYRKGIVAEKNSSSVSDGGVHPALHPNRANEPAQVTWKIASAYVIVGGKASAQFYRASDDDALKINLSRDGQEWETIWTADETGELEREIVFDDKLSPRRMPQYEYFLQVSMRANGQNINVGIESIEFETDVQMSLLGLPELELGQNQVKYVDETKEQRQVRITHSWVERNAWKYPESPRPTSPENEATVEGTQVTFRWDIPTSPDGSEIEDYHFQLSNRPDMRWPFSPNFDKLISNTPSRGKTEWTVPYVGLLNPDTNYYWRVRAKNANGVWGKWSVVSSFRCVAPGVPLNVKATADSEANTVILSWDANPKGRPPAAFKIYGSDEKGFTISDTEYSVVMGRGFCADMDEYNAKANQISTRNSVKMPSNFMTTTKKHSLIVVGPDITLPNANKAFYRVVAVDERGITSGPSDYAEFPRPFIYSRMPTEAAYNKRFRHQVKAIASIGDLKCKGGYNAAFWDREILIFSLTKAPDWLKINTNTGELTVAPTPDDVGQHEVILRVTNNNGVSQERRFIIEVKSDK